MVTKIKKIPGIFSSTVFIPIAYLFYCAKKEVTEKPTNFFLFICAFLGAACLILVSFFAIDYLMLEHFGKRILLYFGNAPAIGQGKVIAVDISGDYLSRLVNEKNILPVRANSENLPFFEEFDVIVSTDVMEHALNMGSFLYSIHRALKPSGKLCLWVPFRENLMHYSPHLGCPSRFIHLRTFNKQILPDTMEGAGFSAVKFRLNGFNLYNPRNFWTSGDVRQHIYSGFQKSFKNPVAVNRLNNFLARLFMKPIEISILAIKKPQTN